MMQYKPPPNQPAYYEQVWTLVRQVPHGKVVTYGQIAQMIPLPAGMDPQEYKAYGPRWVGDAMAACPTDVPWQRVINAQGACSTGRLVLPADKQQRMLESEGVIFSDKGRCDLSVYRWEPEEFSRAAEDDEQPTLFSK